MSTIAKFSSTGSGIENRVRMAIVGVARGRPFSGKGLYASLTKTVREQAARVKSKQTVKLKFDLSDLVDTMIFEEIFIDHIYPMEQVPFEPEVVIDAGACRGLFTLLSNAWFPNAFHYCIEPVPGNLHRLRENLELNSINATVLEGVVAAGEGTVHFSGNGFGGAITPDSSGVSTVQVIDIKKLLYANESKPLILKMDIEGAEAEVLPQIVPLLPPKCVVFLETHHSREVTDEYMKPLAEAGFALELIRTRPIPEDGGEYIEWILIRDPAGVERDV